MTGHTTSAPPKVPQVISRSRLHRVPRPLRARALEPAPSLRSRCRMSSASELTTAPPARGHRELRCLDGLHTVAVIAYPGSPTTRKPPLTYENRSGPRFLVLANGDRMRTRSRPLSRDRTRCPRCPASRCTTRRRHRQAIVARVPRRARPVVHIRPQVQPGALHLRARRRPARQDAADS
jgi:hypothetical protein